MSTLKEYLLVEMDPERKNALSSALKKIAEFGKGSWQDPDVKKARKRQKRRAQEKTQALQARRDLDP